MILEVEHEELMSRVVLTEELGGRMITTRIYIADIAVAKPH